METPQEAARFMNLGVYMYGRKHRVLPFQKAKSNDLCIHCSAWGHLERNCRFSNIGRCGKCSGEHRTEDHAPRGKNGRDDILKCPNCHGAHDALNRNCLMKCLADEKAETKRNNDGKNTKDTSKRERGAPLPSGRRRQK